MPKKKDSIKDVKSKSNEENKVEIKGTSFDEDTGKEKISSSKKEVDSKQKVSAKGTKKVTSKTKKSDIEVPKEETKETESVEVKKTKVQKKEAKTTAEESKEKKKKITAKSTESKEVKKKETSAVEKAKDLDKELKKPEPDKLAPEDIAKGVTKKYDIMKTSEQYEKLAKAEEKAYEVPELPFGYGENKIVLLARDPHWLYSYWEITQDKKDEIKNILGEDGFKKGRFILRVYDITDINFDGTNAHSHFDIHINDFARSWYIYIDEAGRSYCVDLAFKSEDGRIFVISRSNSVLAPRDFIAPPPLEEKFMYVEEKLGKIETIEIPVSKLEKVEGRAEEGPVEEQKKVEIQVPELVAHIIPLKEETSEIKREVSEKKGTELVVPEQIPTSELEKKAVEIIEEIRRLGGSEALRRIFPKGVPPELITPSGVVVPPGMGSPYVGSFGGYPGPAPSKEKKKDFWLVVNTELILYGATEPDASVTVQGVPIKLRPDGTFTIRYALPDCKLELPVHATSADGTMEREITPVVVKKTR